MRPRSLRKRTASSVDPCSSASAASSSAASTNCPAMNTDSATPPSRLGTVWNDSPGSSENAFRFRQSFQSARPINGSP